MKEVAIRCVGLVTSVGLSAASSCAAIRARITNPVQTRFRGPNGNWIVGHQVYLPKPLIGIKKLTRMAELAAIECLNGTGVEHSSFDGTMPLLLCTAEIDRPGRLEDLDNQLYCGIQTALTFRVDTSHSAIFPLGRTAVMAALGKARHLITEGHTKQALIVATDSLLSWPTLKSYLDADRVLDDDNANGFIPGEGAGALLVTAARADDNLHCIGFGSGFEPASLSSDKPLRGNGLTAAVSQALRESCLNADDIDFIAADLSGENYFFKEAALARSRALRGQTRQLELWHPAECTGEAGALAGAAVIAALWFAAHKGYTCGSRMLVHSSGDGEHRFAAAFRALGTR